MEIPFYDSYFSIPSFIEGNPAEAFKAQYIKSRLIDERIYKFVALTSDEKLNSTKFSMLREEKFWASYHIYFEDKNEVSRKYDVKAVSRKTNIPVPKLLTLFRTIDEMNNVSCFTYSITNDMWNEYANKAEGFCMEFQLLSANFFFPVVYVDKRKVDMTDDIIQSFLDLKRLSPSNASKKMAILPWVLKDQKYQHENELRFLCGDEYDNENGIMGGRIAAGKKELMGIRGLPYSFDYARIKLRKVHIGANCKKVAELREICELQQVDIAQ